MQVPTQDRNAATEIRKYSSCPLILQITAAAHTNAIEYSVLEVLISILASKYSIQISHLAESLKFPRS